MSDAEPFEETLRGWIRRVDRDGGTVQEHYAIDLLRDLAQVIDDDVTGSIYLGGYRRKEAALLKCQAIGLV